jgi:putative tricarboxylic transport membrane protein
MGAIRKTITRMRGEGLVVLLLALGYLWEAHNVPSLFQMPGVPGPTVFPLLLGIVFAGSGLWLIISPKKFLAKKGKAEKAEDEPKASLPGGGSVGKRRARGWHFVTMWIVLFGYLFAMPLAGFPLSTAVLLAAFFFLLGEKRWYVGIGLALIVTILVYLGFAKGLAIRLPLGILGALWPSS